MVPTETVRNSLQTEAKLLLEQREELTIKVQKLLKVGGKTRLIPLITGAYLLADAAHATYRLVATDNQDFQIYALDAAADAVRAVEK